MILKKRGGDVVYESDKAKELQTFYILQSLLHTSTHWYAGNFLYNKIMLSKPKHCPDSISFI